MGGTLIATVGVPGWLVAKTNASVSATWILPDLAVSNTIFAIVNPDGLVSEFDQGNNSTSISLGVTNLEVTLLSSSVDTNGALTVMGEIRNTGGVTMSNAGLVLRRSGQTNIIGQVPSPVLDPGRLARLAINLPAGTQQPGEAGYVLALDDVTAVVDASTNDNQAPFIVNLAVDSDGDGMPDDWELARGLNPNDPSDALLDADHDGMSNLAEFQAGTDPNNAGSFLKVEPLQLIGNNPSAGVQISWGSVAGHLYTIERSTNLSNGFVPIFQHIAAIPPMNSLVDIDVSTLDAVYYRVRLE